MDEVVKALQVFSEAGLDPREVDVPAMAAAEDRPLIEIAERVARARRIALDHDAERGTS